MGPYKSKLQSQYARENLLKNYKAGDSKKLKSLSLKLKKGSRKSSRQISHISSTHATNNSILPTTLYQDKHPFLNWHNDKNKLLLEAMLMLKAYFATFSTEGYPQPHLQEIASRHKEPPYSLTPPTTSLIEHLNSPRIEHDRTAILHQQPLSNHFMVELAMPVIAPKVLSMTTLSICLSKTIFFQEQVEALNAASSHVKVTASKLIPIEQNDQSIQSAKLFIKGCIEHTLKYVVQETNKEQPYTLRCIDTAIPFTCYTTITFSSSNEPLVMSIKHDDDDPFELSTLQGTHYGQVHCELIGHTTDEMIIIENNEQLQSSTQQTIAHMSISMQLKLELTQQQQVMICQQVMLCQLKPSREKIIR